jgi:hypothetical protein
VKTNVHNLRPVDRPYDHEMHEQTWVQLTDVEWSLLQQAAHRSGIDAAAEVADRMADQVRRQQQARRDADIRDARGA